MSFSKVMINGGEDLVTKMVMTGREVIEETRPKNVTSNRGAVHEDQRVGYSILDKESRIRVTSVRYDNLEDNRLLALDTMADLVKKYTDGKPVMRTVLLTEQEMDATPLDNNTMESKEKMHDEFSDEDFNFDMFEGKEEDELDEVEREVYGSEYCSLCDTLENLDDDLDFVESLANDIQAHIDFDEGRRVYNPSNDPYRYAEDNNLSALEFNLIKYVTRHRRKNGIDDLKKAVHTLDRLIEEYYY